MRTWDSPLQSVRSAAFLAGAAAVLLSANSVLNDFAFDDVPVIVENTAIQDLGTLPEALVSPYWPNEYGRLLGLWRPVATALYGMQWAVWGENPAMFHLVNVLLHGVVTALVVLVLAELAPLALAFVGGLLFAVHPVHVEAVANVVGLAEVFSSALYLGACLVFLRAGERIALLPGAAITFLFVLAFLTKESAITLPGVLFPLSANVRETRSTQRIRVGRRQRKRTCWDCEREWKRMVVPLEPGRPSEARQLLRTRR